MYNQENRLNKTVISMRRINYQSDFKELVTISDSEFFDVPFRFIYRSGNIGSIKYIASYDGKGTYINCRRVDESHILVVFDNHNLQCGELEAERRFYVDDSDFNDGIYKFVDRYKCGVILTNGASDVDDSPIASTVVINAIKGKSAYDIAVDNGFVGTLDEWLELGFGAEKFNDLLIAIASAKSAIYSKAEDVIRLCEEAKSAIETAKTDSISTVSETVNQGKAEILAQKEAGVTAINDAASADLALLAEKQTEIITAIKTAKTELDTLKSTAVEAINNALTSAETDISQALSSAIASINTKVSEVLSSISLAADNGKGEIDGAKNIAIEAITTAKNDAIASINALVSQAEQSATAAKESETNAKASEDAARQYAEGAEGSAASALEKAEQSANSASAAESSASTAEQKAIDAAAHAANVNSALDNLIVGGDVPEATVAQVVKNTDEIAELGTKLSELEDKVADVDGGNVTLVPEWNNDGAYNRVGVKNIASGVNTDLIDVSGYTSFSVSGTLGAGSGRYSIFYRANGSYIAVSEGEFEDKSVESVDLTDIVSMKLSFANSNNKTIRLSKDGEISLLKKKVADIENNVSGKASAEDVSILKNKVNGIDTRLHDVETEMSQVLGGYTDIDLAFIDGGAYNAGDPMNGTPSISSGKYTKAIDVAAYKSIRITGELNTDSGRRCMFFNKDGAMMYQPTESSLKSGSNVIDLTGVKYAQFSFAPASVPVVQGEVDGLEQRVEELEKSKGGDTKSNVIECWGDSLTAAGIYEREIADYVGDKYQVLNCGIAGETPYDICARMGAMPLFLKNDVSLPYNQADVTIGNLADSGMQVINTLGNKVNTLAFKQQAVDADKVNPIEIDGVKCLLTWRGAPASSSGYYTLCRTDVGEPLTLKAGTQMFPYAPKNLRNPHAIVLWMGTNVGGSWDITSEEAIRNTLLKQIKNAIQAIGTNNFVVVGLHLADSRYRDVLEKIMYAEFGMAYFDLRKYLITDAIRDANLTPTSADTAAIAAGNCPPQLLKDGTHFTDIGYKVVGQQILKRMINLGIVE